MSLFCTFRELVVVLQHFSEILDHNLGIAADSMEDNAKRLDSRRNPVFSIKGCLGGVTRERGPESVLENVTHYSMKNKICSDESLTTLLLKKQLSFERRLMHAPRSFKQPTRNGKDNTVTTYQA
jgi:hypothetical protein